jgi:hypothetical protein
MEVALFFTALQLLLSIRHAVTWLLTSRSRKRLNLKNRLNLENEKKLIEKTNL